MHTDEDKIDLSALTCGGKAWRKGGRKCAMERRSAAMQLNSAGKKAGH